MTRVARFHDIEQLATPIVQRLFFISLGYLQDLSFPFVRICFISLFVPRVPGRFEIFVLGFHGLQSVAKPEKGVVHLGTLVHFIFSK